MEVGALGGRIPWTLSTDPSLPFADDETGPNTGSAKQPDPCGPEVRADDRATHVHAHALHPRPYRRLPCLTCFD